MPPRAWPLGRAVSRPFFIFGFLPTRETETGHRPSHLLLRIHRVHTSLTGSYTRLFAAPRDYKMDGHAAVRSSGLHNIYAFLKYTMFLINGLIFIGGCLLLGVGLWIIFAGVSFVKIIGVQSMHFINVAYFCIVAGCLLALLGFIACCGAIRESRCLLMTFLLILLALFIAEVACAVLALVYSEVAESILKDKALKSLKEQYTNDTKGIVSQGWNTIMDYFSCCGFSNYTDFNNSAFRDKTGLKYPPACCKKPTESECDGITPSDTIIHTKLCFRCCKRTAR
ncbi:tetraspanin-16 isoform X2 [Ascaphus truei]|uniref:tetraspanin-16 isoform X2 n=1 Tax=Ascaphus truei TaxID=8439 RepID=UPI003F5939C7